MKFILKDKMCAMRMRIFLHKIFCRFYDRYQVMIKNALFSYKIFFSHSLTLSRLWCVAYSELKCEDYLKKLNELC